MSDNVFNLEVSFETRKKVKNQFPSLPLFDDSPRIAIVGEAPGATEEEEGIPFVGASGRLLNSLLSTVGVSRQQCFVGNVCQIRPPANDITKFPWDGAEVQDSLMQLQSDLRRFNPNIIIVLGNYALRAAKGLGGETVSNWRGSLFFSPTFGCKCIASFHPAYVLRDWSGFPLLHFDLKRAAAQGKFKDLHLPQRKIEVDLDYLSVIQRMDSIQPGAEISVDIEGGLGGWTLMGIATSATNAFIVDWRKYKEPYQFGLVAKSLSRLLYRTDVIKILQNSLYDQFVLAYGFNMIIRNVREDTMLKGWEIYSELPKGLGVQASIWTFEPYYKVSHNKKAQLERINDPNAARNYRIYCGKDCTITAEICYAQDAVLRGSAREHYKFNVSLLEPLLYMELRGLNYDIEGAQKELSETLIEKNEYTQRLEIRAGYSLVGPKKSLVSQRMAKFLYKERGYPTQFKREKGRVTDKVTTDVEALLHLMQRMPDDIILYEILKHRKLEKQVQTLQVTCDPDRRVRCGYNLVGTETGRLSCYSSPTGSGTNLQTITKKLRKLYRADPDHWMFQCDLSGADGWTVAARLKQLGDPTMWDDYEAGLKPAKILALMYAKGVEINQLSRDELKKACKLVDGDGWLYFACKRVQHGTNYGMKEQTMITQIMKDSYKMLGTPIYLQLFDAKKLQQLYLVRYPGLPLWHNSVSQQVGTTGKMTAASGHTRQFFGRRGTRVDHTLMMEALANEPQDNTTYATNMAMYKLWNDPDNRYGTQEGIVQLKRPSYIPHVPGSTQVALKIEPLHQVHDALMGQFHKNNTEWAKAKVRSYFQNYITVGNMSFIIPFEGTYGPSWFMHRDECGAVKGGNCDCDINERSI